MSDKSESEVDRFEHAGLTCKVAKMDLGHWCGYVKRPESVEPVRWTSDYDSKHDELLASEVDVWGGVTYGPDDDGWVGFDDAHYVKLAEKRDADSEKAAVKAEAKRLAEQIAELDEPEIATDGGVDR